MNTVAICTLDAGSMPDSHELTEDELAALRNFALSALSHIGLDDWDLSLSVCSPHYMERLNKQYRHKDGPTDVLSFSIGETVPSENGYRYIAGDVVLCIDVIKRNADDFKVSVDEELCRLIVHGILHLTGMDHATNDPAEPMLERQERIVRALL